MITGNVQLKKAERTRVHAKNQPNLSHIANHGLPKLINIGYIGYVVGQIMKKRSIADALPRSYISLHGKGKDVTLVAGYGFGVQCETIERINSSCSQ